MQEFRKFHESFGSFSGKSTGIATGIDLRTTEDEKYLIISPIVGEKFEREDLNIRIPVNAIEDLIEILYRVIPDGVQEYFPITKICRDDVESKHGPAAHGISDSDMIWLAKKMADDYLNQLYWGSMEILAEEIIPEPDCMFARCPDCNRIFVIPESYDCPYCKCNNVKWVSELADGVDMKELDKKFEDEFPDLVITELFDLAGWVENHQEFMAKNNLIYEPTQNLNERKENVND